MAETVSRPLRRDLPAVRRLSRRIIGCVKEPARRLGYAIAVHGSLERDVDLLAVPWTEEAASPSDLVEAIRAAIEAEIGEPWFNHDANTRQPNKPHGRSAYTLTGFGTVQGRHGAFPFVDLSVMPRLPG